MKPAAITVLAGGLLTIFVFQFKSIANLQNQVRDLRAELGRTANEPEPRSARTAHAAISLGTLPQRVSSLEHKVASLSKTSDLLTERGIVPPTAEQAEQMQARFYDVNASDRDRLRAFQMIRRNGAMTEDLAAQAAGWLQTSTNIGTRRELLRQMDGLTNAAIRGPLVAMISTEENGGVREELVDVLSEFASDPDVEQKLWDLALNDQDEDVREEAEDALTEGQMTPERIGALQQKAGDSSLSLDARLLALRGLDEANASAPEAIAEMASLAQNSTDPLVRAKLFEAFDDIRDPQLMAPLVYGLQDPNPVVRERAADALGSYGSDERIQQWLHHVVQNDADSQVKREAFEALEQAQRRRDRGN